MDSDGECMFENFVPDCRPSTTPLPDRDLENFLQACVNKITTARRSVVSHQKKCEQLRSQIEGQSYPAWLTKKFMKLKLCNESIDIECKRYTENALKKAEEACAKAVAAENEPSNDWSEFMSHLTKSGVYDTVVHIANARFEDLLAFRKAGLEVKSFVASKKAERAKAAKADKREEDIGGAPTTEEIGALIKHEVEKKTKKIHEKIDKLNKPPTSNAVASASASSKKNKPKGKPQGQQKAKANSPPKTGQQKNQPPKNGQQKIQQQGAQEEEARQKSKEWKAGTCRKKTEKTVRDLRLRYVYHLSIYDHACLVRNLGFHNFSRFSFSKCETRVLGYGSKFRQTGCLPTNEQILQDLHYFERRQRWQDLFPKSTFSAGKT